MNLKAEVADLATRRSLSPTVEVEICDLAVRVRKDALRGLAEARAAIRMAEALFRKRGALLGSKAQWLALPSVKAARADAPDAGREKGQV